MSFLHLSLLGGLLLAGIPVMLHMLSRGQPQPIVFPALRFVRQTAITAERGWRVKHWLLLGIRILLIGLLAAAFAAPRVHHAMLLSYLGAGTLSLLALLFTAVALVAYAGRRSRATLVGSVLVAVVLWMASFGWLTQTVLFGKALGQNTGTGPISAALIVDTSPTMEYRLGNQTRLDLAKEMGRFVIERTPLESEIAIVATDQEYQQKQDRLAAVRQLERVTADGKAAQLAQRIRAGVELVRKSKLERREVYVLTDFATSAWRDADRANLASLLAVGEPVLLQIVDVGVEKPNNWTVANPQLSQEVVLPGTPVQISAKVFASKDAPRDQLNVELWLESDTIPTQQNGQLIKPPVKQVDRRTVEVPEGGAAKVDFYLRDLTQGVHHAYVRLRHPDPLAIDNELSLTIDVRAEGKVLVVSDEERLGNLVCNILSLEGDKASNTERLCELVSLVQVDRVNLTKYRCVVLVNPSKNVGPASVSQLDKYVQSGGSLMLLLGPRLAGPRSTSVTSPLDTLLPGKLVRITRAKGDSVYWNPKQLSHPIFHELDQVASSTPWYEFPIYRHWDLEDLKPKSEILVTYTGSGKPAVVEELRGTGRIITWTSPYPESEAEPWASGEVDAILSGRGSERAWNDLYSGNGAWPAFAVMRGSVQYLSGWGKTKLNYTVGQTVLLENDAAVYPEQYQLFLPNNETNPIKSDGASIVFPHTRVAGTYRLLGANARGAVVRGFSVNIGFEDTVLDRLGEDQIKSILGDSKYSLAKDRASITSSVGQARFGRELYPYLVLLVAFLLIADQAMSRKFYQIRLGTGDLSRRAA